MSSFVFILTFDEFSISQALFNFPLYGQVCVCKNESSCCVFFLFSFLPHYGLSQEVYMNNFIFSSLFQQRTSEDGREHRHKLSEKWAQCQISFSLFSFKTTQPATKPTCSHIHPLIHPSTCLCSCERSRC